MAKFIKMEEALDFSWENLRANFWFWAGIIATVFAVPFGLIMIAGFAAAAIHPAAIVLAVIVIIATMMGLYAGVIEICLKYIEKREVSFADLFSKFTLALNMIGGFLLFILIMIVGFFLFIIPGFIWMYKYFFWPQIIVDKKVGPIAALTYSSKITKGAKFKLFLFYILLVSLMMTIMYTLMLPTAIIGGITTGVLESSLDESTSSAIFGIVMFIGMIIAMVIMYPIMFVSLTYIYRHLDQSAGNKITKGNSNKPNQLEPKII